MDSLLLGGFAPIVVSGDDHSVATAYQKSTQEHHWQYIFMDSATQFPVLGDVLAVLQRELARNCRQYCQCVQRHVQLFGRSVRVLNEFNLLLESLRLYRPLEWIRSSYIDVIMEGASKGDLRALLYPIGVSTLLLIAALLFYIGIYGDEPIPGYVTIGNNCCATMPMRRTSYLQRRI